MTNQYKNWSEDQIKAVWEKGMIVPGCNPNIYRQDIAGAWIEFSKHGNTSDEIGFGWEIDHRIPEALNGPDDISNLRPLQWSNNRSKGDNYPEWTSIVSSEGGKNIRKAQRWTMR